MSSNKPQSVLMRYGNDIAHMDRTMKHLAAAQFGAASRASVSQLNDFIARFDEIEACVLRDTIRLSRDKRRYCQRGAAGRKAKLVAFSRKFESVIIQAEKRFQDEQNDHDLNFWLDFFLDAYSKYDLPADIHEDFLPVLRQDFSMMREAWGFFSKSE